MSEQFSVTGIAVAFGIVAGLRLLIPIVYRALWGRADRRAEKRQSSYCLCNNIDRAKTIVYLSVIALCEFLAISVIVVGMIDSCHVPVSVTLSPLIVAETSVVAAAVLYAVMVLESAQYIKMEDWQSSLLLYGITAFVAGSVHLAFYYVYPHRRTAFSAYDLPTKLLAVAFLLNFLALFTAGVVSKQTKACRWGLCLFAFMLLLVIIPQAAQYCKIEQGLSSSHLLSWWPALIVALPLIQPIASAFSGIYSSLFAFLIAVSLTAVLHLRSSISVRAVRDWLLLAGALAILTGILIATRNWLGIYQGTVHSVLFFNHTTAAVVTTILGGGAICSAVLIGCDNRPGQPHQQNY